MAATKKKYPTNPFGPNVPGTPTATRGGCKVGWATFATKEEADKAAEWAKAEAAIKAGMGYDFGYQVPGGVTPTKDGQFEVCLP